MPIKAYIFWVIRLNHIKRFRPIFKTPKNYLSGQLCKIKKNAFYNVVVQKSPHPTVPVQYEYAYRYRTYFIHSLRLYEEFMKIIATEVALRSISIFWWCVVSRYIGVGWGWQLIFEAKNRRKQGQQKFEKNDWLTVTHRQGTSKNLEDIWWSPVVSSTPIPVPLFLVDFTA